MQFVFMGRKTKNFKLIDAVEHHVAIMVCCYSSGAALQCGSTILSIAGVQLGSQLRSKLSDSLIARGICKFNVGFLTGY
jgi:hypothetical protein